MSGLYLWDPLRLEELQRLLEGLAASFRGEKTFREVAHLPPGHASGTCQPDPCSRLRAWLPEQHDRAVLAQI